MPGLEFKGANRKRIIVEQFKEIVSPFVLLESTYPS